MYSKKKWSWQKAVYLVSRPHLRFEVLIIVWRREGRSKRSPLGEPIGRLYVMLRANDGFGEPRDKANQPCLISARAK